MIKNVGQIIKKQPIKEQWSTAQYVGISYIMSARSVTHNYLKMPGSIVSDVLRERRIETMDIKEMVE